MTDTALSERPETRAYWHLSPLIDADAHIDPPQHIWQDKQRFWTESPLKNPPSYYMDHNVWGSFIQDRIGILNRKEPGGKNIMWSSDHPHSETGWPKSRGIILRDFKGVPDNDIRDIICNNAKKLFRL